MGWFFEWRDQCPSEVEHESLVALSVDRVQSQVSLVVRDPVDETRDQPSRAWLGDNQDSRQDSQGVGVTQSALPALDGNDGLVGPDDTHVESVLQSIPDSIVDVDLPLGGGDTSGLGVVDGIDTSVQVALSSGEFVSSDWWRGGANQRDGIRRTDIQTYHR